MPKHARFLRNPWPRLLVLLRRAKAADPKGELRAVLATADRRANPAARFVLVKNFQRDGLVFSTDRRSRKGRELRMNPRGVLLFYWPELRVQLCFEGPVEELPPGFADRLWAERPRKSQLSARASCQSAPLGSRTELVARVAAEARRFRGRPVPRPAHWTAFRLAPWRIEIWTRREHRLHDREEFLRGGPATAEPPAGPPTFRQSGGTGRRFWLRRLLYP